jgi:hypothetical protein
MLCAPKEQSNAPPQKPLDRAGAADLRDCPEADPGGSRLSPGAGRPCGRGRPPWPHRLRDLPRGPCRTQTRGAALCAGGAPRLAGSPALRATAHRHVRVGTAPPSPGRSRPPPAWLPLCPGEVSRPRPGAGPPDRSPAGPCQRPRCLKQNTLRSCRPPGRLKPPPAALASGSLARAALESRARRGESIVRYAEATIVGRLARPRLGWGRRAQR